MGYETTLIFIEDWKKKFKGYCQVVASCELHKVGYDKMGELIALKQSKIPKSEQKEIRKDIDTYERLENELFNREGNYAIRDTDEGCSQKEIEKSRDFDCERKAMIQQRLEKKLLMIYWGDNNKGAFSDQYGDILLIADAKELRDAIVQDNAKHVIENGNTYSQFDIALGMLNYHIANDDGTTKVVMWGH